MLLGCRLATAATEPLPGVAGFYCVHSGGRGKRRTGGRGNRCQNIGQPVEQRGPEQLALLVEPRTPAFDLMELECPVNALPQVLVPDRHKLAEPLPPPALFPPLAKAPAASSISVPSRTGSKVTVARRFRASRDSKPRRLRVGRAGIRLRAGIGEFALGTIPCSEQIHSPLLPACAGIAA